MRSADGDLLKQALELCRMAELKIPVPDITYEEWQAMEVIREEQRKYDESKSRSL